MPSILAAYKQFLDKAGNVKGVESDDEFNKKAFIDYSESRGSVACSSDVSASDHLTATGLRHLYLGPRPSEDIYLRYLIKMSGWAGRYAAGCFTPEGALAGRVAAGCFALGTNLFFLSTLRAIYSSIKGYLFITNTRMHITPQNTRVK